MDCQNVSSRQILIYIIAYFVKKERNEMKIIIVYFEKIKKLNENLNNQDKRTVL